MFIELYLGAHHFVVGALKVTGNKNSLLFLVNWKILWFSLVTTVHCLGNPMTDAAHSPSPSLGVAICSFNSSDVILDCLESLLASTDVALSIVIADNCSTDGTVDLVRAWARGDHEYSVASDCPFSLEPARRRGQVPLDGSNIPDSVHRVCLVETGVNTGFAGGVNRALAELAQDKRLTRFWILNPDSMVPPTTAHSFASMEEPATGFALMGGRVLYLDSPEMIQIDGGMINRWTGVTNNIGLFATHAETPPADPRQIDFITGASMVASRRFYELAGPMPEEYFLYYEEVDWAQRRGDLPLLYCPGGIVYHRAGTSIGSANLGRPASPFSLYFKHRGRVRFIRRYFPASIPFALAFSVAKAGQLFLKGYRKEACAIITGSFGLTASPEVRSVLSDGAHRVAFGQ